VEQRFPATGSGGAGETCLPDEQAANALVRWSSDRVTGPAESIGKKGGIVP